MHQSSAGQSVWRESRGAYFLHLSSGKQAQQRHNVFVLSRCMRLTICTNFIRFEPFNSLVFVVY